MGGEELKDTGFCYFVRVGKAVKIGWASRPTARLAMIQTDSPTEVEGLGVIEGPKSLEKTLHSKFAGLKIRGEWFREDKQLTEYIAANAKDFQSENQPSMKSRPFAVLRSKNRIVLPPVAIYHLGVKVGDVLLIDLEEGRVVITGAEVKPVKA